MRVDRTHHVDRIPPDPDQAAEATYVYDLFHFREGSTVLVARSYAFDPQRAHFLRREVASKPVGLTVQDMRTPLFTAAVAHLRAAGLIELEWLNVEGEGYEPIPI
jgi:hypothetical protein